MALRAVVVMLVLVWAGFALAQTPPVVGTPCSAAGNHVPTVSFTCTASGTNRWVGLGISLSPHTESVSSISYGTGTPTQVAASTNVPNTAELRLYGLINPDAGPQTVTLTYSNVVDYPDTIVGVLPLSGVHQGTPLGTAVAGQSTGSDTVTVTVSSAATERVIDAAVFFYTGSVGMIPGATQTEHLDLTSDPPGHAIGMSSAIGAATRPMSWTFITATDVALSLAVPVKPVAAAADQTFFHRRSP